MSAAASASPRSAGLPAGIPARLGSYDIVGVIGQRPLATTLLGCMADPTHGGSFQRPVAIKRIAPEWASKKEFVVPFLEAIRTTTNVRHDNVVPILEVGREGDELFLVMQYLEGETCAAMMKRLQSRGETLDFTIAAYLAAEACAGLQAAHDVGIIHGHLDPSQIFIGYDGTVRVFDLGIAAAAAKCAPTTFRGARDLQYASPERCRGEPLDRTSDVFSMGAILWELSSGMSAFDRVAEADVIRAICEEAIVPPSSVVRGLPEQLSMITMQALERRREDRFASMLDLRRDLLSFVRLLAIGVTPNEDLSKLLRRLFEERVSAKAEMLRRVQTGADISDLAIGDDDEPPASASAMVAAEPAADPAPPPTNEQEPSVLVEPSIVEPSGSAQWTPDREAPTELSVRPQLVTKRTQRAALFGALLGLVAVLAILITLFFTREPKPDTKNPPPAKSNIVAQNDPPPTATPSPSPSPSPTPAPTPEPTEAVAVPVVTTAEQTTVHIETVPSKAMIFIGNTKKGVSPLELKLPKGKEPVFIEIRNPGYQTHKERVVPDMNQKLKLTLTPAPATHTAPAASSVPYHRFD